LESERADRGGGPQDGDQPHDRIPHGRPLLGITLKVASVAIFVCMQTSIKFAGELPVGQIVFFRSFFALLPVLALFAWRGELRSALSTRHPFSHVARGLVGVCAMASGFFALTRLPLPEAITLNYAQPLLVVVFSALFLGETIRIYRWSAVVVGLVGVVIISWPKLTLFESSAGMGDDEALGVIAALTAACTGAVALMLIRRLVRTEKSATIVLWFSLTASTIALFTIPFGWQPLSFEQAAFLIAAGICGGVAQVVMTECYRYAEVSTVAPFEYTSMIFGIAAGYLAFGDLPTLHTIVGGAIVIGAGIFIIWREHRLGIKREGARKLAPPA
jgi:drug/metabolite transporter (DMT)-like permease